MRKTLFSMHSLAKRRFIVAGAVLTTAITLSACAQPADPVVVRDSLTTVTEDPSLPTAAEEFSAELHPDPIASPVDCSAALVITVRGTGEPSKGQLLSPVMRAIKKDGPTKTTSLDLDYPADTEVKEGGTEGVRLLVDTLNVQAEECVDQDIVLLGYSQGALIIGEALSIPANRLIGGTVGEITAEAADQIAAIVMYGDPRFLGDEDFNAGDFDPEMGGLLPRLSGSLKPFEDLTIDFCVENDFVCQADLILASDGDLDETGHVAYFDNGMQKEGATFALGMLTLSQARTAAENLTAEKPSTERTDPAPPTGSQE